MILRCFKLKKCVFPNFWNWNYNTSIFIFDLFIWWDLFGTRQNNKGKKQNETVSMWQTYIFIFCTVLLLNEWVTYMYNLGKLVERKKGKEYFGQRIAVPALTPVTKNPKKITLHTEFMVALFLRRIAISYLL